MGLAIIVKGVSFADADLGSVTLSGNRPIEALSIVGDSSVVSTATYRANLFPANTTQRGIVWSIDSGGAYATINSSTGELYAIEGADEDTVVIRATSSVDNTIYATKTLTVSFTTHTIVPLAYIAADGGKYIDTGKTGSATTAIEMDFKIPNIELNNTTDRQMVYSDTLNVSVSYSKKFNIFAINYVGARTKTITSFYDRGLVESSANENTLYDKDTSSYVTMSTSSIPTGEFGNIYLFSGLNANHTYKKVSIYEFTFYENNVATLNLKPVLYDGVPCFYDSVSETYIQFSGATGNIWYATAEEPGTEILYTA